MGLGFRANAIYFYLYQKLGKLTVFEITQSFSIITNLFQLRQNFRNMLGVQKPFSTLEGRWKERGFRFSSSSHSICSSSSSILSAQHPACHFQGGERSSFSFLLLLPHDMMDLRIWGIKIMLWRRRKKLWAAVGFFLPSSKGKIKAFIFGFFKKEMVCFSLLHDRNSPFDRRFLKGEEGEG